jgi:hypothetical protein
MPTYFESVLPRYGSNMFLINGKLKNEMGGDIIETLFLPSTYSKFPTYLLKQDFHIHMDE